MSAEKNMELARQLFRAFNERKFEGLEGTLLSPALVYKHHGQESDLRHWLRDARECVASFPDARITIESEQASGDQVTVHYRFKGTHLGPLGKAQATGRAFDVPARSIFRMLDGLIVEDDDFVDEDALAAQLGLA
jgi:predicted ester cyclase